MTLHNLLPFCGPNIISDGLTNGLFIHYYRVINRCQVWCHDIYTESFIVARYGDMTFIESHSSLPGMVTWHLYRVIHCCQIRWHDIYTESSSVGRYGDVYSDLGTPASSLSPDSTCLHSPYSPYSFHLDSPPPTKAEFIEYFNAPATFMEKDFSQLTLSGIYWNCTTSLRSLVFLVYWNHGFYSKIEFSTCDRSHH